MIKLIYALTVVLLMSFPSAGLQAENQAPPSTLTLDQCLDLALKQNPSILKAKQEIRRTYGLVVEARAPMIPQLTASGQYTRIDPNAIDKFPFAFTNTTSGGGVEFGNQQQPWQAQV